MKTHEFDVLSFLAGLFMTGIGLVFLLLADIGTIIGALTDAGAWFWPVLLIVVGIAVLLPAATRRRADETTRDHDEEETLR